MRATFYITLSLLLLGSLVNSSWAKDNRLHGWRQPMDQVIMPMTVNDWTTTKTAKAIVTIDVTLTNVELAKARQKIMTQLQGIAKADWHITRFQRSQDQSGLERLQGLAEARIEEAALSTIYVKAKEISKPGVAYQIQSLDFSPSPDEIEQLKSRLRAKIYFDAKEELERLNKIYDNQQYRVHRIDFSTAIAPERRYLMKQGQAATEQAAPASVALSHRVWVSANVILASKRPNKPSVSS